MDSWEAAPGDGQLVGDHILLLVYFPQLLILTYHNILRPKQNSARVCVMVEHSTRTIATFNRADTVPSAFWAVVAGASTPREIDGAAGTTRDLIARRDVINS